MSELPNNIMDAYGVEIFGLLDDDSLTVAMRDCAEVLDGLEVNRLTKPSVLERRQNDEPGIVIRLIDGHVFDAMDVLDVTENVKEYLGANIL